MLIIRDGWGINPGGRDRARENGDATLLAHTPFHDQLYANYPMGKLSASGEDVGLPKGQMGNSEVGAPESWSGSDRLPGFNAN